MWLLRWVFTSVHFGQEVFFCHAGVWSSPSGCTACRFFRSPPVDAVHYIFGLCTAVYFGRWNCKIPPDAFVFQRHPFPSPSGMSSCYVGLGPPGRTWTLPFIRGTTLTFHCDGCCRSGASWITAVSGHCGNSLVSVRGTELTEGSVVVGYILDFDGLNVIVASTRYQFWYRGHRFDFRSEFNVGHGSNESLWKVFLRCTPYQQQTSDRNVSVQQRSSV